jgi:hypothetical protein
LVTLPMKSSRKRPLPWLAMTTAAAPVSAARSQMTSPMEEVSVSNATAAQGPPPPHHARRVASHTSALTTQQTRVYNVKY